jgi:hypothetical protein
MTNKSAHSGAPGGTAGRDHDALQRAKFALHNQRPQDAERIAGELIKSDPRHSQALNILGYALLMQGRADEQLLDSYEAERIAFAHRLIATTDTAFKVATSPSRLVGFWRHHVMPKMMSLMLATRAGSHLSFRTVSQIGIQYRASPISSGARRYWHSPTVETSIRNWSWGVFPRDIRHFPGSSWRGR